MRFTRTRKTTLTGIGMTMAVRAIALLPLLAAAALAFAVIARADEPTRLARC